MVERALAAFAAEHTVLVPQGVVVAAQLGDEVADRRVIEVRAHVGAEFGDDVLKPGGLAAFVDSVSRARRCSTPSCRRSSCCAIPRTYAATRRAEWEEGLARAGLVVTETRRHRVRLAFKTWVERMATPSVQVDAIRALQGALSASVTRHFEMEQDGSFTIDVAVFEAAKAA